MNNSIQSAQKQVSEESKGSFGVPRDKFLKPLTLARHGSSQAPSASESLSTPGGWANIKRNLSILDAANLGPHIQSSLIQNIALTPAQMGLAAFGGLTRF